MFRRLFETCKIGNMELKNRLVMPPLGVEYARNGFVTDRLKRFYAARAKGGVGLIIVGFTSVDWPVGNALQNVTAIDDDKFLPGLRDLACHIKANGAKAAIQLAHAGRRAGRVEATGRLEVTRGLIPVAPSSLPHPVAGYVVPKELSFDEIQDITEKFAEGARRAKEAGFDAVEIHCAHMYLLNEFLSQHSNRRCDEYGIDFEGRMKFPLEVVRRVRETVGKSYPILCRINAHDGAEGGNTLEDSKQIAVRFEKEGIDAIDVSAGSGFPPTTSALWMYASTIASSRAPRGCFVHLAEGIKSVVGVPVITANRINDPQFAERILEEGKADLVAMGRALVADPELPIKAAEGRLDEIRPCIADCIGCAGRIYSFPDSDVLCTVNPAVGREDESTVESAKRAKRVLVVGGGPAGLEAARVAVLRGHQVSLYEKNSKLGGKLDLAAMPPGKQEIANLERYLVSQVKKLGVEVVLGKEVDLEVIKKIRPDVVIIAAGDKPLRPKIPGIDGRNVVTAADVLAGRTNPGEKVAVLGGGQTGAETAEYLAEKGKEVTVIEMLRDLATDMPPALRVPLLFSLEDKCVRVLTKTTVRSVTEEGVIVSRRGINQFIKADTVVLALGAEPNREVYENMKDECFEIHLIGDALKPRRILDAIHEGFETARKI